MVRILGKRPGELSVEDVEQLVTEQRHEDRHLEYKRQLPAKSEGVRVFVQSIAALANTEGGVVIFGVEEENHVPKQVVGLVDAVEDVENRRLESYAREHIDPGVTNLIPHWHDWRDGKKILILEVPRSLSAPHGIDGTYYGRQTGAKYPMPTNQLRQLFLERALWEQEAEDFRKARVEGFLSDTLGLLGTTAGASVLVHILPLGRTREHDVVADTIDYNWDQRRAMARDLLTGMGRDGDRTFTDGPSGIFPRHRAVLYKQPSSSSGVALSNRMRPWHGSRLVTRSSSGAHWSVILWSASSALWSGSRSVTRSPRSSSSSPSSTSARSGLRGSIREMVVEPDSSRV